ncbi:MAG: AmmeMemoRadiSam system protein A [Calditrichaeota bacterium]|nr:AmmeMemoRadiSam system protein A [Calditrichota bacterium]
MSKKAGVDLGLTDEEKLYLLRLARDVISKKVKGINVTIPEPPTERLHEKRGAFVTLNEMGQLRGCIGYIEAIKPLYLTIAEMAESAAFRDPRFPPVTADEVPNLEIEISVLTPLRPIESIDEIQVGRHGLLVRQGFYQGLLLPQVATDYGWDRETFLTQTCHKAGLPGNCWKEPETEILIFSADIFSEKDFNEKQ